MEYYFVTRGEFENMIAQEEFLEYAEVFGNYYGTSKRFLREAGASGEDPAAGHRRARQRADT